MVWLVLTTEIEAASKLELRRSYTNELISTCSLRHCSMCSLCCPTPNRSLPDRSRQRSCQCGFVQSRTHATICLRVHFPVVDGESDVNNHKLLEAAIAEARKGINEGGLPIGSVLADRDGNIVATCGSRAATRRLTPRLFASAMLGGAEIGIGWCL